MLGVIAKFFKYRAKFSVGVDDRDRKFRSLVHAKDGLQSLGIGFKRTVGYGMGGSVMNALGDARQEGNSIHKEGVDA